MTPRIDISGARKGCAKPRCTNRLTYRHHRGGEHTFVRHFRWMRHYPQTKQQYAEFRKRYEAFHPEDIVEICGNHHEEIHYLIDEKDVDWMVENDCISTFSAMTWDEAMRLIEARRNWTDAWLKEHTPGRTERRYTQYP